MVGKWLLALRSPQSFVGRVDTLIFRWLEDAVPSVVTVPPASGIAPLGARAGGGENPRPCRLRGKTPVDDSEWGDVAAEWWSGVWPLALFQARVLLLWP